MKSRNMATSQSINLSLYFAFSPAALLNRIRIPIYTRTDSNPTIAKFRSATYHFAIFSCKIAADDSTGVPLPSCAV